MQRGTFGCADEAGEGIWAFVLALRRLVARHLAGPAADYVERAIAYHADHPGLRTAPVGIIAVRQLPDLQEGVMQCICGQR